SRPPSDLFPRLEDLPAAVHAGLEIDVVGPAQLARILVFHIGRPRQRIGGAAHPASRRRCFAFRDGHVSSLLVSREYSALILAQLRRSEAALIEDRGGQCRARERIARLSLPPSLSHVSRADRESRLGRASDLLDQR